MFEVLLQPGTIFIEYFTLMYLSCTNAINYREYGMILDHSHLLAHAIPCVSKNNARKRFGALLTEYDKELIKTSYIISECIGGE